MEMEFEGALGCRRGPVVRLTISLERSDDDDLPLVGLRLTLRENTLSSGGPVYEDELAQAATELTGLVDGQQSTARIWDYDHEFFLLRFDSLPDDPDLVSVSGRSHHTVPSSHLDLKIDDLPVRGKWRNAGFYFEFDSVLISRPCVRDLADMIGRLLDPKSDQPVGAVGEAYRHHNPERAVLPPPVGAPERTARRARKRPRPGNASRALPIIEEALAVARAAPPRPREGLLAAIADVLAQIDPERAVVLVTEEANLTALARARAVEVIASMATGVSPERIQEWHERAGAPARSVYDIGRVLATGEPARALEMARAAAEPRERVALLWGVVCLSPEPYQQQARAELLGALKEAADDSPRFQGFAAEEVAGWLAEVDPPAAVAVLSDLSPSTERPPAFRRAAEELAERAPHLLPELVALAEANPTPGREAELGALVEPLAKVDPHRALAVAREIADASARRSALTAALPALAASDPAQAWEVVVEAAELGAAASSPEECYFDANEILVVAARLPERVEELIPLLRRGALKELYLTEPLLRYVAQRNRELALQIASRLPAEERLPAAMAIVEGAARADPEWALEAALSLSAGRHRVAEPMACALAEVGARWALEFARRTGDGQVPIAGARHARWWAFDDPAAARELAELALQAQPSAEDVPDLAVLLALADPDRAMEAARGLESPERKVATMLDIAERVMGTEEQWWVGQ